MRTFKITRLAHQGPQGGIHVTFCTMHTHAKGALSGMSGQRPFWVGHGQAVKRLR